MRATVNCEGIRSWLAIKTEHTVLCDKLTTTVYCVDEGVKVMRGRPVRWVPAHHVDQAMLVLMGLRVSKRVNEVYT